MAYIYNRDQIFDKDCNRADCLNKHVKTSDMKTKDITNTITEIDITKPAVPEKPIEVVEDHGKDE